MCCMKSHSLFSRLLTLFVCLLLPLLICGVYILNYSVNATREDTVSNVELTLSLLAEDVSASLERAQTALLDHALDSYSAVRRFSARQSTARNAEYYLLLREVFQSFNDDISNAEVLSDIVLYHPRQDTALSTKYGISSIDEAELEAIVSAIVGCDSLVFSVDGQLMLGQLYPYSAKRSAAIRPDYLIIAHISQSSLRERLTSGAYGDCPTALLTSSGAVLSLGLESPPEADEDGFCEINGERYIAFSTECGQTGCTIVKYLPYDSTFGVSERLVQWMMFFVLLSVPIFALYAMHIRRTVYRPLEDMKNAFTDIGRGNLKVRLPQEHPVADFCQLNASFNQMAEKLRSITEIALQEKQFSTEMELKHLQSQINPHFLYNSFFHLKQLIQSDDLDAAMLLSDYLGSFFRYITRSAKTEMSLREEFEHAECYLNIQRLRFRDRLIVEITPPDDSSAQITVPRLILQPLLENAFLHGQRTDDVPNRLSITFGRTAGFIQCVIDDNGNTLTSERLVRMQRKLEQRDIGEETTGMINIHRRLRLHFGNKSGLTLSQNAWGGLRIQMHIQIPHSNAQKEF